VVRFTPKADMQTLASICVRLVPTADKMGGRILIYVKALFATPHDTSGLEC